jgi:hypothetical protein
MRIGCNGEVGNNMYHNIFISIAGFCETRASGKMISGARCREQGGQIEVVLPDKTRCDCVTNTHAIEFDFGSKWAEAIYMRIR